MEKYLSVFEKTIFGLVIFLLIFIPLYPKFPLVNLVGTFVAIRVEDILIALVFSLWFFYIIFSGKLKNLLKDRLTQALMLFFLIGFVSLFSGIFLTQTVSPQLGLLHYLRRIEYMGLLPVVAMVVKSKKQLVLGLITLSIVVLLVNIYALGQRYLNWPVISTTNSEFAKGLILYLTPGARVNSTFAGHYDLAVFLTMALVMLGAMFFSIRSSVFKLGYAVLMGLSLVVLVMTAARVSFVAALAGIISSLILTRQVKFIILIVAIGIGVLVYPSQLRDRFISTITINVLQEGARYTPKNKAQEIRHQLNIPTLATEISSKSGWVNNSTNSGQAASDITPGEPVDTTELGVYRSFAIRLNIEWPRALNAFYKNPLLGTGYSSLGIATDNDLLRSLGEVGLLGTVAFALVLTLVVKRVLVNLRSSDRLIKYFSAGVLGVIVAFVLNGSFIDVFEASKVASIFWMILGLGVASERFK